MAIHKVRGALCAAVLVALGVGIPCRADTICLDGTSNTGSSSYEWEENAPTGSYAGPQLPIIETDLLNDDLPAWGLSPTGIYGDAWIDHNFGEEIMVDDLNNHLTTVPVPEPGSIVFLLAGLGITGWIAFRRKKAAAPFVS